MIGFIVNPIAGMGGSVGLKGTDGDAYVEAVKRGAKPVSPAIARRFVKSLEKLCLELASGNIISAPGIMGEEYLKESSLRFRVVDVDISEPTTADDTKRCARRMVELGVKLIVFVGGDGTARDVLKAVDQKVPILGVPSGVKMYSGVFAVSPEAAASIVCAYLRGEASICEAEVADIDEDAFRRDVLRARVYGIAKTVAIENLLTPSKEATIGEEESKKAIAKYFAEHIYDPSRLFILGPGSTVKAIADELGIEKTLLGFDAVLNKRVIARDLWGKQFIAIVKKFIDRKMLVITPIGGQGFLIGRGNKQLTPEVLSLFRKEEILIVATPRKIAKLRFLIIDSGDPKLDERLSGYYKVLTGYGEFTVIKVVPAHSVTLS